MLNWLSYLAQIDSRGFITEVQAAMESLSELVYNALNDNAGMGRKGIQVTTLHIDEHDSDAIDSFLGLPAGCTEKLK